ncbi:MAG: hypothetical protein JSV93_05995 [Candidatus Omnitrophota bacterium]|nr:MAG: hypothetical protein JSV93_05995 [Candidatus Omnitrophota bacterium]
MANKIKLKIPQAFKALWREFRKGSYFTLTSLVIFGILLGIFGKPVIKYPEKINDWITWLILWFTAGAWLKINFQSDPKMEIKVDVKHDTAPPRPRISHELDRKGTLYIDAVLNFINRSNINNSIVSETYLVSGDNKKYVPAQKKMGTGSGFIKEINLPDVYRPYTARKQRVSLTVDRKDMHGILENGHKYRIKFIYEPINGRRITLTIEKEIDDFIKEKYRSL